jgi:hypothetical protein
VAGPSLTLSQVIANEFNNDVQTKVAEKLWSDSNARGEHIHRLRNKVRVLERRADEAERRAEEAERQLMVAVGRCEATRDDWMVGRCRCGETGGAGSVGRPIVVEEAAAGVMEEVEREETRSQASLVSLEFGAYL